MCRTSNTEPYDVLDRVFFKQLSLLTHTFQNIKSFQEDVSADHDIRWWDLRLYRSLSAQQLFHKQLSANWKLWHRHTKSYWENLNQVPDWWDMVHLQYLPVLLIYLLSPIQEFLVFLESVISQLYDLNEHIERLPDPKFMSEFFGVRELWEPLFLGWGSLVHHFQNNIKGHYDQVLSLTFIRALNYLYEFL